MFTSPYTGTTTSLDYAELAPGVIWRVGRADSQSAGYSTDGGVTWMPAAAAQPGTAGVVAVSADGSRVVWSPENAAVQFSADNGGTWTPSAGIPAGARVASDRVDAALFYGFAKGTFYASIDGEAAFTTTAAAGLPKDSPVRFKAAPGQKDHIWLAGGSDKEGVYGLWFSRDSGASFTKLRSVDEADTIGFGKAAPGERYPALYAGAQIRGVRGIYRSDDCGWSWQRINDDRHQYAFTGAVITGDTRVYGRVYIGTNGRGIIAAPDMTRPVFFHHRAS